MLAFDPRRRSEDMTPVVRDVDVTRYAMAVLKEYMPERLERPGHMDTYKFIEQYLGANVEIMNIYTDSRDDFIAGAAVFNPQHVKVFDRDNMTTKKILVPANTVIIDEQVTGRFKKGFERFTVLHEAGHLMMHKEVYRIRHESGRTAGNSALCMRSNIGSSGRLVTSLDFREHQADVFAAAVALPADTLVPCATHMIKCMGFPEGVFVTGHKYDRNKKPGLDRMIANIAEACGVSRSVVKIRLQRLGLLQDRLEYGRDILIVL